MLCLLKKIKFFKVFLIAFIFGFFVFIAGAEDSACNCEEILCNPDCIQICSLKMSLKEIRAQLIKNCFGGDNSYHLKKENISAKKIAKLIEKSKKEMVSLAKKSEKSLKEKCPDCDKLYKISAKFDFKPEKETCPQKYLKTHSYTETKKMQASGGTCNKDEILTYLESYATYLVTKQGLEKKDECISSLDPTNMSCKEKKIIESGPFKSMSLEDKKLMKSKMKKLWASCPSQCSFLTSYTSTIDSNNCSGKVDIKVDCTHKVKTSFFVPIYDVKFDYEPDLQCKGVSL